ncbi:MAG: EAL domain-containing protein [Holophagales bacterium]|nr:EAL domain-containing protein [Holophagales bacterium]
MTSATGRSSPRSGALVVFCLPRALTFEITETAAHRRHRGPQLWARRLKELGGGFALDDFRDRLPPRFPPTCRPSPSDLVKIDGSFVRDLDANPTNRASSARWWQISHALRKTVVAEMVRRGP